MKNKLDLERKIQDTLDSLDGISRAEPQPYFYTRLKARMQQNESSVWENIGSFLSRPVVVVASLCMVLILNAFILFRNQDDSSSLPVTSNEVLASDNEYVMASSSSFEYENIDPQ